MNMTGSGLHILCAQKAVTSKKDTNHACPVLSSDWSQWPFPYSAQRSGYN